MDIVSGFSFNFFATYSSTFGETLEYVPTGPDILQTDISFFAFFNLVKFLENSAKA